MSSFYSLVLVAVVFIYFDFCSNLKVIPERANIEMMNTSYVDDVSLAVRRYGRKSNYYLNGEITIKHTWGDNISMHVVLFEYLHNEYRRSFVEFHFARICELINSDPYIGKSINAALKTSNLTCPMQPGHIVLPNMTMPMDEFPYLWPFQRAKAVTTIMCGNNFIINGSIYLRFEQKKLRN